MVRPRPEVREVSTACRRERSAVCPAAGAWSGWATSSRGRRPAYAPTTSARPTGRSKQDVTTPSRNSTSVSVGSGTSGTGPAALTLTVIPTSVNGIATASSTGGTLDATVADRISQLGSSATAPDRAWATFVAQIGTQSKAAATQSTLADASATAATSAQTSQSGVDLDEESTNLIVFQHAYQGAARVLTAVDQMLDTLINHTGVVGMA